MSNVVPRSIDPLVVGKVIGDVLDMFVPTIEFSVEYLGLRKIVNGVEIKQPLTVDKPKVHIIGSPASNNLYTLILVDPDAPSPSEPTLREWLHWIVTDIPEGSDASKGREVVEYVGPSPPMGIHRYVFALFRQAGAMQLRQKPPPENRANFKTWRFAADNGLGLPVAALYFNCQKQPNPNKKR